MADSYKERKTPTIVNTDLAGNPGVHWVVAMRLSDGSDYIYDPLGPHNKRGSSLGVLTDRYLIDNVLRAHIYPYQSQMATNKLCGWHAIYVATLIKRALAKRRELDATAIDELIKSKFGTSADSTDIDLLERFFER